MRDTTYLSIVESVYAAAADPSQWNQALGKLAAAIGGQGFVVAHDPVRGTGNCFWHANWATDWAAAYDRHFAGRNPWLARVARRPLGRAEPAEFFLSRADLHKTEWYNDFLRPQGLGSAVGVTLLQDRTRYITAGVLVPERDEAEHKASVALLQLLAPHLQRALQVNRQLAGADIQWQAARACFDRLDVGVVLMGDDRRIRLANAQAQRILREGDGLSQDRDGHLRAASGTDDRLVQAILRSILAGDATAPGAGGILAVRRRSARRPYGLLIAGLRPSSMMPDAAGTVAIVFIMASDAERTVKAETVAKLLELTGAEARVVTLLASGMRAPEIGPAMNVSYHTVRTLLARAMAKTETTTQANLVRLAVSVGGGALA